MSDKSDLVAVALADAAAAASAITDWINGTPCVDPSAARALLNRLSAADASAKLRTERMVVQPASGQWPQIRHIADSAMGQLLDGAPGVWRKSRLISDYVPEADFSGGDR